MNRYVRVSLGLFVVTVALSTTGCSSDVSGTVVSQTTGAAIASATVSCGDRIASTDVNGAFALEQVKNGEREVEVSATGYPRATMKADVASDMEPINLVIPDSRIRGRVTEVALEPKPITEASVTVGSVSVELGEDGSFEAAGLPPGDTTITVAASNHEVGAVAVTLKPGDNTVEVPLSLDVKETYRRYNAAQKYGRFGASYKYLHPDVRKLLPLKKYLADQEDDPVTIISLKIGDTRVVKSLRSKYTRRTYKNVTQVDRQLIMEYPGYGRETDNWTQHWQKIDGKWYLIWNFPR